MPYVKILSLPHREYDWQRTVYAGAKEEIPHDIPEPKWKHVTTTTYVDANLHHDQVTGRAVTACLHLVNATPSHGHTKRQATVETATFGSEFVAARIATDQIIDLRYTLIYPTYNSQSTPIFLGIQLISSKGTNNNMIFLFQEHDTF